MSFRLLGIRIRVGASFLLLQIGLGVFIAVTIPTTPWLKLVAFLIIGAIVFVSVLVHEMGHALAARRAGLHPDVTLTWFGGYTRFIANVGPGRRLWISAAGVVMQAAMAAIVWVLIRQGMFGEREVVVTIAEAFVLFNLVMAAINLIPVGGMDGGAILGSILELLKVPRPRFVLLVIYGIGGAIITLIALLTANWILFAAGIYVTWVGVRGQVPYVRFEQDAMANPQLEATVRRFLLLHRFEEAADIAAGVLESTDSTPYRIFATNVLLDALRLSGNSERLRTVLSDVDLSGVDSVVAGRAGLAAGDHEEGGAVLRSVLEDRSEPLAAVALARAHVTRGDPSAAVTVVGDHPALFDPLAGLEVHALLVDAGALEEAAAVRQILGARRTAMVGATAHMLMAEGRTEEGLAVLERDHELGRNRTTAAWLASGLRNTGRDDAVGSTTLDDLPGELEPAAAQVLVYLYSRRGEHEEALAIGLPVVVAGTAPDEVLPYNVAASLDAVGRVEEALDVIESIDPEYLVAALAEHDDFADARRTSRFAEIVERLARSRV